MAYSGKNGGVYTSSVVLDDCETDWTIIDATVADKDGTDFKVGTYSIKVEVANILADKKLAYGASAVADIRLYDVILMWLKIDTISVVANDLAFLIDEGAAIGGPEETLSLPALTKDEWTRVALKIATPGDLDGVTSMGFLAVEDLDAYNLFVDDIRALKEEDGIKSWTIEKTVAALDVTDFADTGEAAFIPSVSEWHGTFEGYKEEAPLAIGSEVYLILGETSTMTHVWIGKAIITDCRGSTDHDGVVSYSYDFQGTGALQIPTL